MYRIVLLSAIFTISSLAGFCSETEGKKEVANDCVVSTQHSIKINGRDFPYTATAGTLCIKDNENGSTAKANLFYIAYTKDNEKDLPSRPISFCFNGGPGSASIWLHLGGIGPMRIQTSDDGIPVFSNKLEPNPYSLLDLTDLVFVDPISTGYSKEISGVDAKEFHGYDEDVSSLAQFVRLYLSRNGRWASPKYLIGESYGTTRVAGLANYLHTKNYIDINGLILISMVLNHQTIDFSPGNDLPYILFLPSYTATAWYHKKLSPQLQANFEKTIKEAQSFAENEYSVALLKGDTLSEKDKEAISIKIAKYTGLEKDVVMQANLRITPRSYVKDLFNIDKNIIGRFDSRFKGGDARTSAAMMPYDPSFEMVIGSFTATMNDYVNRDLKWPRDDEYKVLTAMPSWNYGRTNRHLNVSSSLSDLMVKLPCLKVYVASGFYDLATPHFASDYTLNHLDLDPVTCRKITISYFDAGHMMYLHKPSLIKLKQDLTSFYK